MYLIKDPFKEITEEIKQQTKKNVRKDDIFYLLDNECNYDESDTMSLKYFIAQINSFDSLDKLYKFIILK